MAIDKTTYAPFQLLTRDSEDDAADQLRLDQDAFEARGHVFEATEMGFIGNGYDWGSVARVVVEEELPDLQDDFDYDPEAGGLFVYGPVAALKQLAAAMQTVYNDEDRLRDVLTRAELD